ncbi:putative protein SSX6 [Choloepus didactylus]|uniref:putative protein SSX6 n=1 Tax=Choloepus didactylus TaxID=27675 RepID=UPI00189D1CCC|nr:putative protein SSX6 [Choloepus didactylus]
MNRDNSFAKRPKEKSKAFKDVSKYFSEEEWEELGYSEKISYVYMKRNYDTMTKLGNRKFWMMSQKSSKEENRSEGAPEAVLLKKPTDAGPRQAQLCSPGKASTSGQQRKQAKGPRKEAIEVWTHRLRERKNLVVYEEISDPEEDD